MTRLTENKIIFYKFCETLDLPIPETFAYFYRDIGLRTKNGKSLFGREEIAEFLSGLQSDFVIKPSEGVYGQGVHGVIRNGNEYLSGKGEKISLDIVIEDYIYKNPFNELIIQQRLKCHRFLADLSGSENLQTYRIVTYMTENGEIEILLAHLKTIVGNNFIDNNEKGKTGNIISYIDIDKGEIFSVKLTERKGNGAKFLEVHPVSGKKLIGVQLPEFDSAVDLVKKAAPHFYPLRTIGWDVGVTDDGIYIIEGNAFWDPVCFNSKFPPILSKLKQDR